MRRAARDRGARRARRAGRWRLRRPRPRLRRRRVRDSARASARERASERKPRSVSLELRSFRPRSLAGRWLRHGAARARRSLSPPSLSLSLFRSPPPRQPRGRVDADESDDPLLHRLWPRAPPPPPLSTLGGAGTPMRTSARSRRTGGGCSAARRARGQRGGYTRRRTFRHQPPPAHTVAKSASARQRAENPPGRPSRSRRWRVSRGDSIHLRCSSNVVKEGRRDPCRVSIMTTRRPHGL